jgi:hypothetical protein
VLAISASVNQRLFERKFHFISVEKLFSEPKIGSKSVLLYQCVANGLHFILLVIQLLAVFHILPFTATANTKVLI